MSENEAPEGLTDENAPEEAAEAPATPDPAADVTESAPETEESAPEEAETAEQTEEARKREIRRNMSSNDRCRRRGLEPAQDEEAESEPSA